MVFPGSGGLRRCNIDGKWPTLISLHVALHRCKIIAMFSTVQPGGEGDH